MLQSGHHPSTAETTAAGGSGEGRLVLVLVLVVPEEWDERAVQKRKKGAILVS